MKVLTLDDPHAPEPITQTLLVLVISLPYWISGVFFSMFMRIADPPPQKRSVSIFVAETWIETAPPPVTVVAPPPPWLDMCYSFLRYVYVVVVVGLSHLPQIFATPF